MTKDIMKRELIGLHIKVIASENKELIGKCGTVIDETKNTLTISEGKKTKKLPKDKIIIQTEYKNKIILVDGKKITKKPEDRIKSR